MMEVNRDGVSDVERRRYAKLQALCLALFGAFFVVFVLVSSVTAKVAFIVLGVASLVAAVVFNWARRFGIRVLWSSRFRK